MGQGPRRGIKVELVIEIEIKAILILQFFVKHTPLTVQFWNTLSLDVYGNLLTFELPGERSGTFR